MTIAGKEYLTGLRNAWRRAVQHLILYTTVKGGDIRGCMKSTGDGSGRREKAKGREWGGLWD